ncbi:hypothetical protein [Nocardia sp. NBC_00403]|uniref:hypothetical protein n=1 Tax=Nocardia sp. NBC_00403 TaxID=2975990 RepID=UPI002E1FB931
MLAGVWWLHVGFVGDEGGAGYGQFGVLSRVELEQFFYLDNKGSGADRGPPAGFESPGIRASAGHCSVLGDVFA